MVMLRITIVSLPRILICVNSLNKYLPGHLPKFLESLRDIIWESPTTRTFLTGRPDVMEDIQRYFTKAAVILINPILGDIRNWLEIRLDRDSELRRWAITYR